MKSQRHSATVVCAALFVAFAGCAADDDNGASPNDEAVAAAEAGIGKGRGPRKEPDEPPPTPPAIADAGPEASSIDAGESPASLGVYAHPRLGPIPISDCDSPFAQNPRNNWVVVDVTTLPKVARGGSGGHPTGPVIIGYESAGNSIQLDPNTDYIFTTNGKTLDVALNFEGGRRYLFENFSVAPTPMTRPDGELGTPLGSILNVNPRVGAWFAGVRADARGMVTDHVVISETAFSNGTTYQFAASVFQGHRGNDALHGDFIQYQGTGKLGKICYEVVTGRHNHEGIQLVQGNTAYGAASMSLRKLNIGLDPRYGLVAGVTHYGGDVIIQVEPAALKTAELFVNGGGGEVYNYDASGSDYAHVYNTANQPPTGGLVSGADPPSGDFSSGPTSKTLRRFGDPNRHASRFNGGRDRGQWVGRALDCDHRVRAQTVGTA